MGDLLQGDRALVTGAAGGIGLAVARALAAEGAHLVLTDIDVEGGEAAAQSLREAGSPAHFLPADLSRAGEAAVLHGQAQALAGPLSVFVHSASPRRRECDDWFSVTEETWNAMLQVNLGSGFELARAVAKEMIRNKLSGRMLFITSLHAHTPRNLPHYGAAKAGQTQLVRELARALGPHGIRVNAIAPGAIPGGGFDAAGAGLARLAACTSLGRLGKPEEVADMAVALLAERFSRYVTGTTVVVDGGLALHNWILPPELAQ